MKMEGMMSRTTYEKSHIIIPFGVLFKGVLTSPGDVKTSSFWIFLAISRSIYNKIEENKNYSS